MAKDLNPRYARLLANQDFKLFLERLKAHRQALFERGETDDEPRQIFERRGQRKMIALLLDQGFTSDLFDRVP